MSAAVRAELAAAANTVTGVKVTPYHTGATKAGAGGVQLDRIEYPNRFGGVCFWQVVILLPPDIAAAEKQADALIPLLYDALSPVLAVTSVAFDRIQLDNSGATLPCVIVAGHRESE
jgi:hypothetical protein